MRVLNRTAVTITGAQPYIDWMQSREADVNRGQLTVGRARPYGTAFLLPEVYDESDLQEWIEDNYVDLFEFQLSSWTEDQSAWPADRDLTTFRAWFRVDLHSLVIDVADDDIEGEEL